MKTFSANRGARALPALDSPSAVYHLDVLPNGLRIATAEMPHMASVSLGLWAAVGARHEAARLNGAAHFLEHVLFKGTRRRDAQQISGEVEALGGGLEAFTAEDHTCYYAKAEAKHLPQLGDVLSDLYRHSRFPAVEVERERGVIREEIMMYADQPAQVAEELLAAAMWPGHPLGRPLAGTEESVASLKRSELMDFWKAGYCARSSVGCAEKRRWRISARSSPACRPARGRVFNAGRNEPPRRGCESTGAIVNRCS